MMGGLAYMTGPPGRPLRTGKGQKVAASLFESTVYLVGQHMAQFAVTAAAAAPMPSRVSAWAIYDVFETKGPAGFHRRRVGRAMARILHSVRPRCIVGG